MAVKAVKRPGWGEISQRWSETLSQPVLGLMDLVDAAYLVEGCE